MGFLDSIGDSINRGTEAVGRGTKTAQLRMRQNELLKERQKLAAQLGAGLYDRLKDDPAAREGMESLFDGIAALDAQRTDIQNQIDSLEAAAVASAAAAVTYRCPNCGASVGATDLFCSGCGKPVEEVKAAIAAAEEERAAAAAAASASGSLASAQAGPACPNCGTPIVEGDAFCMGCGQPVGDALAAKADDQAEPAAQKTPSEEHSGPAGQPAVQPGASGSVRVRSDEWGASSDQG